MTPNERTTEAEKILDVGHDIEAPLHPSYSPSFFLGGPQSRGGGQKKSDLAGGESKKMMGGGGDLSPGNEEESSSPKTFRHGVCKKTLLLRGGQKGWPGRKKLSGIINLPRFFFFRCRSAKAESFLGFLPSCNIWRGQISPPPAPGMYSQIFGGKVRPRARSFVRLFFLSRSFVFPVVFQPPEPETNEKAFSIFFPFYARAVSFLFLLRSQRACQTRLRTAAPG